MPAEKRMFNSSPCIALVTREIEGMHQRTFKQRAAYTSAMISIMRKRQLMLITSFTYL